jgi:hypothetical protein
MKAFVAPSIGFRAIAFSSIAKAIELFSKEKGLSESLVRKWIRWRDSQRPC